MGRTVLVLGDQLHRARGALARAEPGSDRVVMVESDAKLMQRPWHRQKLAYVLSAMRHFAAALRDVGFTVDHRRAPTLRAGLRDTDPHELVVMAPSSWDLRGLLTAWGVEQVPNDAFIVGEAGFAQWAGGRSSLVLESFYRAVRREHGWLMDGDQPLGGRWNFDDQNRERGGPLNSYEGFLRQVCGWREYVWGLYWWRMPTWREDNALDHHGPVPAFYWDGDTRMHCLASTVADVLERGWTHHIPRLMVLGNYALLAGVDPQALTEWFHALFVDAYDWVMVPNVIGMSQWADGGVMASKPYAASANYINRMTTYCGDCTYDRGARTGSDACPFNALYWDFMARHRDTLSGNRRMQPLLSTLDRFSSDERRAIAHRASGFRTDVDGD